MHILCIYILSNYHVQGIVLGDLPKSTLHMIYIHTYILHARQQYISDVVDATTQSLPHGIAEK